MRSTNQQQFRFRVKTWLMHREETVTGLARRINRNRANVSTAINRGNHPRIRKQIEEIIAA